MHTGAAGDGHELEVTTAPASISPFREEQGLPSWWSPPLPVPGVPRGRWVVLVAGFECERKGVDFGAPWRRSSAGRNPDRSAS
jgi:hypothetical protein